MFRSKLPGEGAGAHAPAFLFCDLAVVDEGRRVAKLERKIGASSRGKRLFRKRLNSISGIITRQD